jgi:hypothetical protein
MATDLKDRHLRLSERFRSGAMGAIRECDIPAPRPGESPEVSVEEMARRGLEGFAQALREGSVVQGSAEPIASVVRQNSALVTQQVLDEDREVS